MPATARRLSDRQITDAKTRLVAFLAARGHRLKRSGAYLIGPCPICGGRDRFNVRAITNQWFCRGCSRGGDAVALAMDIDRLSFAEAVERLVGFREPAGGRRQDGGPKGSVDYQRRQHDKAAWLWAQRRPLGGSIAEKYLRQARGIACPLPPTLAFLPATKPGHHPALISAFGLVEEPEPGELAEPRNVESVHLTLLRSDGTGKADIPKPKLIIGSPRARPIVVAPANDLLGLAICEGIEDALSAHQSTGLGAWAAGAAGFLPALAEKVPDYIEAVTIFSHRDAAGQNGAERLATALRLRGMEVTLEGLS